MSLPQLSFPRCAPQVPAFPKPRPFHAFLLLQFSLFLYSGMCHLLACLLEWWQDITFSWWECAVYTNWHSMQCQEVFHHVPPQHYHPAAHHIHSQMLLASSFWVDVCTPLDPAPQTTGVSQRRDPVLLFIKWTPTSLTSSLFKEYQKLQFLLVCLPHRATRITLENSWEDVHFIY